MLPLMIFVIVVVYRHYEDNRLQATQQVLQTVRSIRLVLDAELQRMSGGLQVLAHTDALRDGDFEAFRRMATTFIAQYGPDSVIVVADRDGRQVFSSLSSDTASLPRRNNLEVVEQVFTTKKPVFSNLFLGVVKKRMIITVELPVIRDGEVVYDLSFSPPLAMFQDIVERQRPNADWTISIFDAAGVNFARVPNPQETIGKSASPTLLDALFKANEATLQTVSLEGVSLITSFTRSSLNGWTVGAGIPEATLVAPLWRSLAITAIIGGVLLLIGLAFAVRMATTIARGETLHSLLVEELNHRVKNTLAILQSFATQTFRSASREERSAFDGRLLALAQAHNLLSEEKWRGSDIQDVAARVLQPYTVASADRVALSGPKVPLSPRLAVVLSMILHEMATNAAKYGGLSNDAGKVDLHWSVLKDDDERLKLVWREAGGPAVTPPTRSGFGSRLIERSARDQLGGSAVVEFLPGGLIATIIVALNAPDT